MTDKELEELKTKIQEILPKNSRFLLLAYSPEDNINISISNLFQYNAIDFAKKFIEHELKISKTRN